MERALVNLIYTENQTVILSLKPKGGSGPGEPTGYNIKGF